MNPLSAAIREARAAAGISQRELARRLGVAPSHVARWELGRRPNLDRIRAIEAALGLRTGTLLARAGYVAPDPQHPKHH